MAMSVYNKTIIYLLIFFGASAIVTGVIILPTINDIKKLNQDTLKILTYLEQRSQNVQSLRQSLQQSQKIRDQVFAFDNNIFRDGDELELITMLENTADKNMVVQRIENSNLDETKKNQYVVISLGVTGDYQNVLRYLSDLENNKYFININNLTITSSRNKTTAGTAGNAEANVTISLYVNN